MGYRRQGLIISFVMLPAFFFCALQSFSIDHSHIYTSCLFGIFIGLLFYKSFSENMKCIFDDPKIIIMAIFLFPCTLLLVFINPIFKTGLFYCLFVICYLILIYVVIIKKIQYKLEQIGLLIVFLSVFSMISYCIFSRECFSQDSYSYFELSKTIFSHFYKINTIRQYIIFTDYGISFPYLYPTLIAIFNYFTGLGIYNGIVINIIAAIFTAFLLCKLSKDNFDSIIVGVIATLFLLCNPYYLDEVISARSIPAAILCTVIIIEKLFSLPNISARKIFIAGLAAGADIVIRFDALLVTISTIIIVIFFSKKKRIINSIAFFLGILVFAFPWILFSFIFFHKLWISDNMNTASLVYTSIPLRYYSKDFTPPNLYNNPLLWFKILVAIKLPIVIKGFKKCFIKGGILFYTIFILYCFFKLQKYNLRGFYHSKKRIIYTSIILGSVCLLKTAIIVMVGYNDSRYHVETLLIITLALTIRYNKFRKLK